MAVVVGSVVFIRCSGFLDKLSDGKTLSIIFYHHAEKESASLLWTFKVCQFKIEISPFFIAKHGINTPPAAATRHPGHRSGIQIKNIDTPLLVAGSFIPGIIILGS
jgi:hypothetical protein